MNSSFAADHAHMIATGNAIVRVVSRGRADEIHTLNRLRLELSKAVSAHCALEGKVLDGAEGRKLPPELISRYHDELLKWRRELTMCNSQWPPARIWDDPAGFLNAFRPLNDALKRRVHWEENELYPALRKCGAIAG